MPPAGQVQRIDSMATQAAASQSGAAGSRRRGTAAAPSTPYQTVWVSESPSHGIGADDVQPPQQGDLEGGAEDQAGDPRRARRQPVGDHEERRDRERQQP